MPRVTRAALRTNAILEDEANVAAATPLPSTPTMNRPPLGEVAGNIYGESTSQEELDGAVKLMTKVTPKGRKARNTKKTSKKNSVEKENKSEVLEDEYQSSSSSAVEEAREELLKDNSKESYQVPMHDSRPITPPSKAVEAAVKQLSPKSQTPRFDPIIHTTPKSANTPGTEAEDSFVGTISTRTPGKMLHLEKVEENPNDKSTVNTMDITHNDSFADKLTARTPLKPITRIEDSVEAIDALEEAIEQISAALPVIIDERQSPVKEDHVEKQNPTQATTDKKTATMLSAKKPTAASSKARRTSAVRNPTSSAQKKDSPKHVPSVAATQDSSSSRPTPSKPAPTKAAILTPKLANPKSSTTSAPPSSKKPTATTTAPQPKHARVLSITKAPFVPQRSTKAPTRSTFSLPGDAISQKLKAQREERQKRDEDESSKKRAFKARPVRMSLAPVVKGTAASRARLSLAKGETAVVRSKKEAASVTKAPAPAAPRLSSISSTTTQVNGHSIPHASRTSILAPAKAAARANISAPRASSVAGVARGTVTAKGKEVFGRALAEQEARDAARKEKEDAARKARVEAAERGRIASRQWAEKMKARKEKAAGGVAA